MISILDGTSSIPSRSLASNLHVRGFWQSGLVMCGYVLRAAAPTTDPGQSKKPENSPEKESPEQGLVAHLADSNIVS